MEYNVTEALTRAGVDLATLAVKGTATMVTSKIQSIKDVKDAATLRATYDDLINELLAEREQAIRIAQPYKEEYEKINIDDEDIEYLSNTLEQGISLLYNFSGLNEEQERTMKQLVTLLNKDTLKTMQLIGFNYKQAIGGPLTEACATAIKNKFITQNSKGKRK
ncbi:hypothetical protein QN328_08320 [Streptococcus agalactiae]|uniref:hypothetical protein n=1 Tax=Streptococcus agalactiae TaxID=1311 RepID=UPI00397C75D8